MAACYVRLQMLPGVTLHLGNLAVPIVNRSVGGITGTRVAGALGRAPVEHIISERQSHWRPMGFPIDSETSLSVCAYVDNIYSCSSSVQGAVEILEDFRMPVTQEMVSRNQAFISHGAAL